MALKNLGKRVFFALWAIPLGWWVANSQLSLVPRSFAENILHRPDLVVYPGQLVSILLIFIAAFEYTHMLAIRYRRNGFWLIYIWLTFQFLTYFFPQLSLSIRFDKDIFVLLIGVAAEAAIWGKTSQRWKRASLLFSGTVFLSSAGFSLLGLYQEPFQTIFPQKFGASMLSQLGIVMVVTAIFLCDTFAYFVGSMMGKHHFSSISPKKTVEGSVAGLVASIIVSMVGWYFLSGESYPGYLGFILGVLIGISAQAGDLLVSLMKRYFQVKDASDIIPGHGGILDRFDSIFFTMPIISLFFVIVEKVY